MKEMTGLDAYKLWSTFVGGASLFLPEDRLSIKSFMLMSRVLLVIH